MGSDEIKISDDQVDMLNLDQTVKDARTSYLRALASHFQKQRLGEMCSVQPPSKDEVDKLAEEYNAVFQERLHVVLENPPQPKSIPLVHRWGFK